MEVPFRGVTCPEAPVSVLGIISMFGLKHVQVSLRHPARQHGTSGSGKAALATICPAVRQPTAGHVGRAIRGN
jgi:hypothetical protein